MYKDALAELTAIQQEVGTWGEENFGPNNDKNINDPAVGFVEELGEFAQAVLKRAQGIRGTKEKWDADAADALGDMGIYLLHHCYRRGVSFADNYDKGMELASLIADPTVSEQALVLRATREAHRLEDIYDDKGNLRYGELFARVILLAYSERQHWHNVTINTWRKIVSKRNWKKDAQNGGNHSHETPSAQ